MVIEAMVGLGLALAAPNGGDRAEAPGSFAPLWRGVSRIVLVCGDGIDPALCDAALAAARARTTLPVERVTDPGAASDRGAILLTLAAEPDGAGRQLVAVARRAVEIDEAESPARAAVAWPASAAPAPDALLARLLPRRPTTGRSPERGVRLE